MKPPLQNYSMQHVDGKTLIEASFSFDDSNQIHNLKMIKLIELIYENIEEDKK